MPRPPYGGKEYEVFNGDEDLPATALPDEEFEVGHGSGSGGALESTTAKPPKSPAKKSTSGRNPGSGVSIRPSKPTASKSAKPPKEKGGFKLIPGQLDYDIPNEMKVGKATKCVVRIAGKEVKLKDIKISTESTHQTIMMTNDMGVRLMDLQMGKDFTITSASSERQSIVNGQFSEWIFYVKPKKNKTGIYVLNLTLTAYSGNKKKDLPILEKSICVIGGLQKRVVFMAADGVGLNLKDEEKLIRGELSKDKKQFAYTKVLDLTALKLLKLLIKERPNILHYAGHSAIEGIFMFDDNGKPVLASTESIQQIFESSKDELQLECLMLNSCFSVGQATALRNFTKFLVGTTSKIPDNDAIQFSKAFYQCLLLGRNYKEAYEGAIAALNIDINDPDRADNYKWF